MTELPPGWEIRSCQRHIGDIDIAAWGVPHDQRYYWEIYDKDYRRLGGAPSDRPATTLLEAIKRGDRAAKRRGLM